MATYIPDTWLLLPDEIGGLDRIRLMVQNTSRAPIWGSVFVFREPVFPQTFHNAHTSV